jgi:hypothetical protein
MTTTRDPVLPAAGPASAREEIWNLLHDGGITGVRGAVPGDLTIRVKIRYLTGPHESAV